jgi:hypothetical protein
VAGASLLEAPARAGSPLAGRALAAIAGRLAADGTTVPPPGTGRRWALLAETATYQAWVIAWPQGTGLQLHDHAGSAAGVAVVRGRLRERYLVDRALHTRWWQPGEALALAADHAHEVRCLDAEEAVSIHVYSPRLTDVRFRDELGW